MLRFFPNAKRSLDSLLILITDLVTDGLLFFRLLFRSRTALSAEVLFLRKQLAFYQERQIQPRRLNDSARFSLILWSRLCDWKEALVIVKPETLIGWHRKRFQLFWKGKSQAGRPRIPENIRKLIVQMAQENPTCGQARVSAELSVKLGIYVSPRTVRAYWPPEPGRQGHRRTSSQNWRMFVRKTKNADSRHGRVVDLSEPLAAMLRDFVGGRTGGLVFCKPDGSQLMQRDILKYSLHPILKKLGLEQGGFNILRRFRITKLETAEVPAALQHTWSGHAKSHVSEVYKKLLKQREWRLRWAEKPATGFTLPGHQQTAAETPNGKSGKILEFRKVGLVLGARHRNGVRPRSAFFCLFLRHILP